MPATIQTETWICIDSDGNYEVGNDAQTARERFEEHVGNLADAEGFRLVKVMLTVPLPAIVELAGIVPAVEAPAALCVA